MTTPHEIVSTMTRFKEMSKSNLIHLQHLTDSRADIVIPTQCLRVEPALNGIEIEASISAVTSEQAGSAEAAAALNQLTHDRAFGLTRTGLSDLTGLIRLGVRHLDYQAEKNRLDLLCDYINANLASLAQAPIVVRALEGPAFKGETTSGVIRAIVSTKYQRFDVDDLLRHLLPRVESGELMLLKMALSHYGDTAQVVLADPAKAFEFIPSPGPLFRQWPDNDNGLFLPGMSLSLSETGGGAVIIAPMLIKQMCTNGAILSKWANRKIHVIGERHTMGAEVGVAWQVDTVAKQREAAILEMRDMIDFCLSDQMVDKLRRMLSASASTPVTEETLTPKITARLEKGGVAKETVSKVMALFSAQFSIAEGSNLYDAAQAITQSRDFDHDPFISPLLEEISGDLLMSAI